MNTIDTYGAFDLPEEKSEIEVVEDPIKVLKSCYKLFDKLSVEVVYDNRYLLDWNLHWEAREKVYHKALESLKGKEKLKISHADVKKFIESDPVFVFDEKMGYFLSAVQNISDLDVFLIKGHFSKHHFGYRAKENKSIIVGKSSATNAVNEYGSANVVNYGVLGHAIYGSKNSLFVNYHQVLDTIGWHSENNICINYGHLTNMAYKSKDLLLINLGKLHDWQDDEYVINLAKKSELELEEKIKEIDFLKQVKNLSDEKIIEKVRGFDLNRFRIEVGEIAKKILKKNN